MSELDMELVVREDGEDWYADLDKALCGCCCCCCSCCCCGTGGGGGGGSAA